jgi:hypothetical protein
MTIPKCEQESLVIAAIRSGTSMPELDNHAATCLLCAETRDVARLLRHHSTVTFAQSRPPAASRIWRKIQEQKRRLALKHATRSLVVMRLLAAMCLVAMAAWRLWAFWNSHSTELAKELNPLTINLFPAGVAVIAVTLGSCVLLLMSRRNDFRGEYLDQPGIFLSKP